MPKPYRTRFAPSPTGFLHIGHAYAAKCAFEAATHHWGECLLRIEDIDQTRCRPEYEDAIYEDLAWLGFEWSRPVRRQSDHFSDYANALETLKARELVYPCFLTRREISARLDEQNVEISPAGERPFTSPGEQSSQDEIAVRMMRGDAFAWRLSLTKCRESLGPDWDDLGFEETGNHPDFPLGWQKAQPDWLGDVVLARKDTPTSYHLSVCHDDALQNVTHIVRGGDLAFQTHIHVLLQRLMGWPTPIYHHHKLVLDGDDRKFSKSDHAKEIRSYRANGLSAEGVFQLVAPKQ